MKITFVKEEKRIFG